MVAVIVLIDQVVWRPIIAWSEKFKFEQVEASEVPRSPVLELLAPFEAAVANRSGVRRAGA